MDNLIHDLRYHKEPEGLVIVSVSLLNAAADAIEAEQARVVELECRLRDLEIQVNRTAKNLLASLHSNTETVKQ